MNVQDISILKSVKCLFSLKDYIYSYYNICDITHISDNMGNVKINFDEKDSMKKIGEESINVISAILVDSLLNNEINIVRNDIGDIPSKSDIKLSNGEYLEMKRVPIGTKAYSKDRLKKYKIVSPLNMTIDDTYDFIIDKVKEYDVSNIGKKQKADYIGFYFAVSNFDLHNSSIEDLYSKLYFELKMTLDIFKDVFFIFNRINLYGVVSKENIGETVCLSLKTGKFNSLSFKTPYTREQRIKGKVGEDYSEEDVLSDNNEKHILLKISNISGIFKVMDSIQKGVCFNNEKKVIGYGNICSIIHPACLFFNEDKISFNIIGTESFYVNDENKILPYIIEKE